MAVIVGSACGRVGFDAVSDAVSDGTVVADDVPNVGLIAWWRFDEGAATTVADSVGNTTGTFSGGPITWVPGQFGGTALQFSGNGATVTFGQPAVLADLAALTVSAWIQPTSVTDNGGSQGIFDKGTPTAGWTFEIADNANGNLSFVLLGTSLFGARRPTSWPPTTTTGATSW